jgi:putative transposase
MMDRYTDYGWSKKAICRKWNMSIKTFYSIQHTSIPVGETGRKRLNEITSEEKEAVRKYALSHIGLRHREMSARMIDEDVAYLSKTSVYRILRKWNLIPIRTFKRLDKYWYPHQSPVKADQVWQSDVTHIRYQNRSYYLLIFLDVYSRFIVHWRLCTQMTGNTVKDSFLEAIRASGQRPILQTDNGSCYISHEFKTMLSQAQIEHYYIHPHCPNENAEIERVNRTIKEDLDLSSVQSFEHLNQIVKERIYNYNYVRYHSAIGFITPYTKYRGNPEKIFEERNRKLEKAKQERIKRNWLKLQSQYEPKPYLKILANV